MMGLAADGTLPQQVHKLAAALGLSRHTVQAQQARDEAPYRHARCVAAPRPPDRRRAGRPAGTDTVYAAAVAALTLPKPSPPPLPPPPCRRPPPHRLRLQRRRGKSHQLRLRRSTCRPARQQPTRRALAECHSRRRRPTRAPRCQRPAPQRWTTGPRAASDIHGRRAATIRTRPGGGSRRSRTWASGGSPRRGRRRAAAPTRRTSPRTRARGPRRRTPSSRGRKPSIRRRRRRRAAARQSSAASACAASSYGTSPRSAPQLV